MDDFPDAALRGILNKDYIEEGRPKFNAFKEGFENNGNYYELSINWYDCEEALHQIKDQVNEKKNEPRYNYAVTLLRESIDHISKTYAINGKLSYERAKKEDNAYHGNILVCSDCTNAELKNLSFSLIFCCREIIPLNDKNIEKLEKS